MRGSTTRQNRGTLYIYNGSTLDGGKLNMGGEIRVFDLADIGVWTCLIARIFLFQEEIRILGEVVKYRIRIFIDLLMVEINFSLSFDGY